MRSVLIRVADVTSQGPRNDPKVVYRNYKRPIVKCCLLQAADQVPPILDAEGDAEDDAEDRAEPDAEDRKERVQERIDVVEETDD